MEVRLDAEAVVQHVNHVDRSSVLEVGGLDVDEPPRTPDRGGEGDQGVAAAFLLDVPRAPELRREAADDRLVLRGIELERVDRARILLDALDSGKFGKAYVVLGGEGWTLRNFYTSGGLRKYLDYAGRVEILTLEAFVGRANAGKL